jgi:CheY-like chemotaxis protein
VREHDGPDDLVITDLGMPDVPGREVVEAVKQVSATTPVVILSGFDRARATRRAGRSRDLQALRYPGVSDHRPRAVGRPHARLATS